MMIDNKTKKKESTDDDNADPPFSFPWICDCSMLGKSLKNLLPNGFF